MHPELLQPNGPPHAPLALAMLSQEVTRSTVLGFWKAEHDTEFPAFSLNLF